MFNIGSTHGRVLGNRIGPRVPCKVWMAETSRPATSPPPRRAHESAPRALGFIEAGQSLTGGALAAADGTLHVVRPTTPLGAGKPQ